MKKFIGNTILEEPKTNEKSLKFDYKPNLLPSCYSLWSIFKKILKFISKAFWGAVILFTIAHFVPELREQLPLLFEFIEKVVFGIIEWAVGKTLILF